MPLKESKAEAEIPEGQRAGDRQQVAEIRALDVDLRLKDRRIVEVVDVGVGIGNRYTGPPDMTLAL